MAIVISQFPVLSDREFEACCDSFDLLLAKYGEGCIESKELCKERGQVSLVLQKSFSKNLSQEKNRKALQPDEEVEEAVLEESILESYRNEAVVEYHIVLSPSYRVPVLYFTSSTLSSLEQVYKFLVPVNVSHDLKNVSLFGAISFGENPTNGMSMFFIHPCNTAHAMYEIGANTAGTSDSYLTIWMGLVAGCVGLHVPYSSKGI